ncbi:MAG: ABC transporter permease [Bacteroidales bacterium]|nr:ABC transporter permease [Bacteroidales bacterium]
MKLPLYIAWRYLKSKKSHNVINIISGISVAGVTIGTMALIVVLSVFNGFESLVISLFNSFDPPIKVSPAKGKTFDSKTYPWEKISGIQGVKAQTAVIEEKALLRYGKAQFLVTLKGVDSTYTTWTGLDSMITAGSLMLEFNGQPFAVVGQGVAYYLGVNPDDYESFIEAYAPRRTGKIGANPDQAFNRIDIRPSGIFSVQQDFDTKYVIVPLSFSRELFDYTTEVTSVEIALSQAEGFEVSQDKIKQALGPEYVVKNRFEQQETLYRIMHSEKWAIFLILSFILIIATFNVIGSLSMLILDKKKDIAILHSLGADNRLIKRIFLTEGILVSLSGAMAGLFLGALICVIQQQFGLVKINAEGGSFLIDSYPVLMQLPDFIFVFLTVSLIGLLAAWIPVRNLGKIDSRVAAMHSR